MLKIFLLRDFLAILSVGNENPDSPKIIINIIVIVIITFDSDLIAYQDTTQLNLLLCQL